MDNEMKNGMRELSMDEMDKVSGGAFTYDYNTESITINGGQPMPWGQFCDMMYTIAEKSSLDTAINYMKDTVGFICSEMSVTRGMSARDRMGIILDRFDSVIHGSKY